MRPIHTRSFHPADIKLPCVFYITLAVYLIGCKPSTQESAQAKTAEQALELEYPGWINDAVFYQVYPQSFKDSNGDGIGDLKGIASRLDYIQSLGVDAIWLNPVFESPFMDAGYDVSDYYKVAARYGTNQDMEELIQAAHARNIKVILDLVAGHTSNQHPWFRESSRDESSLYAYRYIWADPAHEEEQFVGEGSPRGNYYKNFFDFQPALNFGYANPDPSRPWEQPTTAEGPVATREEIKKIIRYWMDMGADGFRVDMASTLVKNDPDYAETYKLWGNISSWFETNYPEGALIAEWSNPAQAMEAGFTIDFMMHFGVEGYKSLFFEQNSAVLTYAGQPFFSAKGQGDAMQFIENFQDQRTKVGNKGLIALPTSNHDFQRLKNTHRPSNEASRVALVFHFTWPSLPFLYYGDEIGMRFHPDSLMDLEGSVLPPEMVDGRRANRAGSRTPMQWDDTRNAGFSTANASDVYLPIDPSPDRPTVAAQEGDKASQLNFVRLLIQFRKAHPAFLPTSELEIVYGKPFTYPLIYKRQSGEDTWLIALNPSGLAVEVTLDIKGEFFFVDSFNQGVTLSKATEGGIKVRMEGVSFGIVEVKRVF